MPRLVVISNSQAGLSYNLGSRWVTIGRNPGNAFQIVETSVSGQHCEVLWRGTELLVRDMRSTNGTFIKDTLIAEGVVEIGGVLRLGEVELLLEVSESKSATAEVGVRWCPTGRSSSAAFSGSEAAVEGSRTSEMNGDLPDRDLPVEDLPVREQRVPASKRQLLLVDDSMAFLELAGEVLETYANGEWDIHRACGADQALTFIQQHRVELAVLDISMPMLDGLQLLTMVRRRHPEVKLVVLTGQPNEVHRAQCLSAGAELFLEKPITRDGLQFVFNVLHDLLSWKPREGFSGTLQHVGLTDIIQIECLRRNSSILEIHTPQPQGEIYIESGVIIHAASGGFSGEQALHRLLALNQGQFSLRPYRPPPERTVHGAWEYLLMEAARVRDEERSARAGEKTAFVHRKSIASDVGMAAGSKQ